jgi:membrane protease YdiL (CAAX protease family)
MEQEININSTYAAEWDFLFGVGIWIVLMSVLYFAYYTTIFGQAFATNPAVVYLITLSFIFAASGVSLPQMFSLISTKKILLELGLGLIIGLAVIAIITYGTNITLSVLSPFAELMVSSVPTSIPPYENIGIVAPVVLIAVMEELIVFTSAFFFTSGLVKKFKMGLKDAFLVALILSSIFFGLAHTIAYAQEGILSTFSILFAIIFSLIVIRFLPLAIFKDKTYPIFSAIGVHATYDFFALSAITALVIVPIHP